MRLKSVNVTKFNVGPQIISETYPQKWDIHVQFGINSKLENAIKKVKAFFLKSQMFKNR